MLPEKRTKRYSHEISQYLCFCPEISESKRIVVEESIVEEIKEHCGFFLITYRPLVLVGMKNNTEIKMFSFSYQRRFSLI